MTLEKSVSQYYTTNDLLDRILTGLKQAGIDPDHLAIDDLKPVDELHTGGIEATSALLEQIEITPQMTVIDIGCGIGGAARHIVHRYGARVLGVDLTEEFVATGRALNTRLHLEDRIDLQQGSATALPFDDEGADLVTMFHVGMNIEDKTALFSEVARVLKPLGHFALFDVMRDQDDSPLVYPLPWANTPDTSHVAAPGVYRRAAHAAGLTEVTERDRRQFALDFFGRAFRRIAAEGPPKLGLHLVIKDAMEKLKNYVANVEAHRITPVEMIFRRPKGQ